jgi:membrane associated rhomboid family serine protease
MRSASVGFQCPDDVAAGAATVRQPRTVFGGRVSGDTSRVALTLVAVNVAVFVLGMALGERELVGRFANVGGAPGRGGVADGEVYRLITAAFLHAGALHLAFNMFALASIGPQLESALGRLRFGALYGLSALGGSVTGFVLASPVQFSVGASGAIFGLFGAYYVVVRRMGGETRSVLVLLGINLVITFTVPFIDWRAHVGGLVTGALIAAAFAYAPRDGRRDALHVGACVAVVVLLVVATVARTVSLR